MIKENLSEAIYLRIAPEDRALLTSLAMRLPMKEATIARFALRLGLVELERDPARIVAEAKPKKSMRRKR